MAIFNSYVSLPEGKPPFIGDFPTSYVSLPRKFKIFQAHGAHIFTGQLAMGAWSLSPGWVTYDSMIYGDRIG